MMSNDEAKRKFKKDLEKAMSSRMESTGLDDIRQEKSQSNNEDDGQRYAEIHPHNQKTIVCTDVAQTPQNSLVEEIKQRHRPPPIPAKPKHLLSPIQILEGAIQGETSPHFDINRSNFLQEMESIPPRPFIPSLTEPRKPFPPRQHISPNLPTGTVYPIMDNQLYSNLPSNSIQDAMSVQEHFTASLSNHPDHTKRQIDFQFRSCVAVDTLSNFGKMAVETSRLVEASTGVLEAFQIIFDIASVATTVDLTAISLAQIKQQLEEIEKKVDILLIVDFKTAVTEFKSAINSLSTKQYEAAIDFLTNARINATRAMENFQEKLNQSYDFIKITTCVQVLAVSFLLIQSYSPDQNCFLEFSMLHENKKKLIAMEFQAVLKKLLYMQSRYKPSMRSLVRLKRTKKREKVQNLADASFKSLYPYIHHGSCIYVSKEGLQTIKILPMLLPKGEEDKTVPLKIGVVEEDDCFWSSLGNVGDQISAELWRDEIANQPIVKGTFYINGESLQINLIKRMDEKQEEMEILVKDLGFYHYSKEILPTLCSDSGKFSFINELDASDLVKVHNVFFKKIYAEDSFLDRYEGFLKEGEICGKGTLFYKDGKKFIGNFFCGKFSGRGKLIDKNGEIMEGTFRGYPGLYFMDEEVEIVVEDKSDEKAYLGILHLADGKSYQGRFFYRSNFRLDGKGKILDVRKNIIGEGICKLTAKREESSLTTMDLNIVFYITIE